MWCRLEDVFCFEVHEKFSRLQSDLVALHIEPDSHVNFNSCARCHVRGLDLLATYGMFLPTSDSAETCVFKLSGEVSKAT